MSEENVPAPATRRAAYEPISLGGVARVGMRWLYALVALILAGVAAYMFGVEHRSFMSGYVVAPAIGALWFGLRVFMMLGK